MASRCSPCELLTDSLRRLSISCRTSTLAFSRSMRWPISRYDRHALYSGSRSGNVLRVSSPYRRRAYQKNSGESRTEPTRLMLMRRINRLPICFMISLRGNCRSAGPVAGGRGRYARRSFPSRSTSAECP